MAGAVSHGVVFVLILVFVREPRTAADVELVERPQPESLCRCTLFDVRGVLVFCRELDIERGISGVGRGLRAREAGIPCA